MNPDIQKDAAAKLSELGFSITSTSEILAGRNNQLYKLETNKKPLLLKIYQQDERNRLGREFTAFSFCQRKGIGHVPVPYLKDDKLTYALYSFIEGQPLNLLPITEDDVKQSATFLAKLHTISPQAVSEPFETAVLACFSLQNYLDNVHMRVALFLKSLPQAPQKIQAFNEQLNIEQTMTQCESSLLSKSTTEQVQTKLPQEQWRLSPIDFGPHNTIKQANGDLVFVDFEYFGWDDPLRIVADFLVHDQTKQVPEKLKNIFIDTYISLRNLPETERERLLMVRSFLELEWMAIHLSGLSAEKIKTRQFADKNFDLDAYIEEQTLKFNDRLKIFNNH